MRARQIIGWMAAGALIALILIALGGRLIYGRVDRERLARWIWPEGSSTVSAPTYTPIPRVTSTPSSFGSEATVTSTATPSSEATRRLQAAPSETPEPSATPTATKTKRPKPTPTPTLAWAPTPEGGVASKLGLHVQWNNSPEIMSYVRRYQPPVVKAVGDFGFLGEVKRDSPETVTVGRLQAMDEGYSFCFDCDPAAEARAFVAARIETYLANPAVDYWEGVNEPVVGEQMAWFAAFESERVRAMAEQGLRCALGAFSAGTPEWEQFEAFVPAIAVGLEHGAVFSLHEYDAPTLNRSAGAGLPGHPNYPDRGALALRYRWWYEDFLIPRDMVIPMVVTEVGIEGLIGGRPGPEGQGWRDFAEYWTEQGLGSDPIAAYIAQLGWYDAQLRRDDYVIGCAVFTAGAMNDDWASYDITHMLRHLSYYVVTQQ